MAKSIEQFEEMLMSRKDEILASAVQQIKSGVNKNRRNAEEGSLHRAIVDLVAINFDLTEVYSTPFIELENKYLEEWLQELSDIISNLTDDEKVEFQLAEQERVFQTKQRFDSLIVPILQSLSIKLFENDAVVETSAYNSEDQSYCVQIRFPYGEDVALIKYELKPGRLDPRHHFVNRAIYLNGNTSSNFTSIPGRIDEPTIEDDIKEDLFDNVLPDLYDNLLKLKQNQDGSK